MRRCLCALLLLTLASMTGPALAHKASDAYLTIGTDADGRGSLEYSLALRDWDLVNPALDADDDRNVTWGEARAALPALLRQLADGLSIRCGERALDLRWRLGGLEQRSDGTYVRLAGDLDCPDARPALLRYGLMADADPSHRLLIAHRQSGKTGPASPDVQRGLQAGASGLQVAGANEAALPLTLSAATREPSAAGLASARGFFMLGVEHIGTGYDHLAFLLTLLLPLSLRRQADDGKGVRRLVAIVTWFSIGHSLTLGLAAFDLVRLDARWVEPMIALSIAVSAFLNLRPVAGVRSEFVALAFGLVHGLGFSSALSNVDPDRASLLWALLGFNLGVEAGQLLAVALWCVLQALIVRRAGFPGWFVRGGSVALGLAGLALAVQRVVAG